MIPVHAIGDDDPQPEPRAHAGLPLWLRCALVLAFVVLPR